MLRRVLDLVYPRLCEVCGERAGKNGHYLCWDCRTKMQLLTAPICSHCGDPADGMVEHEYTCSWCVNERPNFDMARSAVRYRSVARDALQSFKYHGATYLGEDIIEFMHSCVTVHYPDQHFDALIAVPLEKQRQRDRSYNQSAILARGLAERLGVEYVFNALSRLHTRSRQAVSNARQRKINVKGAFSVDMEDWVKGRKFLLVDDVMTTGATCNEVSRVLKEAGAVSVCVVTFARG